MPVFNAAGIELVTSAAASGGGGLIATDSTETVITSAVETTVFTHLLVGGSMGATGVARLLVRGHQLNTSGGNPTTIVRLKYGATTLCTTPALQSPAFSGDNQGFWIDALLWGDGSENAQEASLIFAQGIRNVAAGSIGQIGGDDGVATEDSTGDVTITLTLQQSTGTNFTTTVKVGLLFGVYTP